MKLKISLFFILSIGFNAITKADIDLSKHIVRQESFWRGYKNKKLDEKLAPAPSEVIDYLTKDNINNGWPNKPTAAKVSDEYRKDILDALKELPKDIAEKINKKLIAVVTVNDLGGSAYTESVINTKGDLVGGFVVLDLSVLNKASNEWATWKEKSPFQIDGQVEIVAYIESQKNDNRKNALQYILLHEFGHILAIGLESVVPWSVTENKIGQMEKYTFTNLSWKLDKDKFVSKFDGKSMDRKGLRYYGPSDQRLPSSKALTLYHEIKQTNFPTLYAATNPHEDFAESFVTYVHSEIMKKPWKIVLNDKRQSPIIFELCWQLDRCKEKKKALEKILVGL
jgi:hypothetical protein